MGFLCNRHSRELLTLTLETERYKFIWRYFKGNVSFDIKNRLRGKGERVILWVSGRYQ